MLELGGEIKMKRCDGHSEDFWCRNISLERFFKWINLLE